MARSRLACCSWSWSPSARTTSAPGAAWYSACPSSTGGVALRQIVSLHDSRQHETIDPLTGLTNRVGLNRHLDRAVRRGDAVALLLIDLDGFKAVNDTHGHHTGDLLLAQFAGVLRDSIRAGDLACRVGGDEFVVLQRDVTAEADAVALARRIITAAAANPIRIDQYSITARASIGAALTTGAGSAGAESAPTI